MLGKLYSGDAIASSKRVHLPWLTPGQSVLYAGAGTAHESVQAAAAGVRVTLCDTSERMLCRAQTRFLRAGLPVRTLHADVRTLEESFDVVVAPYFLNVFSSQDVGPALRSLSERLRPGGSLITVDFRAPGSRASFRALQGLYYFPPQLLFRVLTNNPWHEL